MGLIIKKSFHHTFKLCLTLLYAFGDNGRRLLLSELIEVFGEVDFVELARLAKFHP